MATTCTSHCSQCGRHFHSLEAFDIHHAHDETGWPICLGPVDIADRDGKERLVALTMNGECRMYAKTERHVTIWTTADYKRAAQHFRNTPETSDRAA